MAHDRGTITTTSVESMETTTSLSTVKDIFETTTEVVPTVGGIETTSVSYTYGTEYISTSEMTELSRLPETTISGKVTEPSKVYIVTPVYPSENATTPKSGEVFTVTPIYVNEYTTEMPRVTTEFINISSSTQNVTFEETSMVTENLETTESVTLITVTAQYPLKTTIEQFTELPQILNELLKNL